MSSLIQGYEYDVFISYRQKDNKYDGWITEFVDNLRKELEATFKDEVSIYFDINPHDGLLETYNVNASLKEKLKCLLFIPVISQTYCDPRSFAWQNEFIPFNKLAREDVYGRDIKLYNGNIASRILPVKIHDINEEDRMLVENELGAAFRSINFIYKEPGVNRPLKPTDNKNDNQNKTDYRNQVNKVANSIKEIVYSIQNPGKLNFLTSDSHLTEVGPSPKSIAVLPFVNMSNDTKQDYFSEGISEEIINTLVQIEGLKVAGRTSAFSFKSKNEDLRSIGEKLNVNTILEGSVRKSGNRIRVNVQLIEASTGFHLWSQKFDRELNDVFIIQDEIARVIVNKLQVTLTGKQAASNKRQHTTNVDAYQLYLKGRSYFYKRGPYMFDALQCFEEALQIDSNYALALAGLADSYTMLCVHNYLPPEESWTKATEAVNRAVQIGQRLAEVHGAIAAIAWLFERNWAKAEKEYLIALELNPRYLQARSWYSLFTTSVQHKLEESLKHARLSVKYDPLSSYAQTILSNMASDAGLYDEAIEAAKRSVEFDPESFSSWYSLGYSNHCAGNFVPAIQAYKQAIDISGRHNWALTSLLSILMVPSEYQQVGEGNILFRELLTKARSGYVSPSLLAIASAIFGKNEDAILYTTQALDRHDPLFIHFIQDRPDNKALLAIPEFHNIMKEKGLH